MLSKRELGRIVSALPERGYHLVAEKLTRTTAEGVRKVLADPKRYKKDVIDAALEVIEEYKANLIEQKQKIKDLTA